jgi:hypothetical protein
MIARFFFDIRITDIMTGAKAFSRSVVYSFDLQQNGFGAEVEMTYECLQKGLRFVAIPIEYSYRTVGYSKITFFDGVKSTFQLFYILAHWLVPKLISVIGLWYFTSFVQV